MHEKIKITNYIYCIICTCSIMLFAGCISSKTAGSDVISTNSRTAGQLEATVTTLDRVIADSTERIRDITESSRTITDGIERLEYLFNEYERENNRIIDELIKERDQLKAYIESNVESNNTLHTDDSSKNSSNNIKEEI